MSTRPRALPEHEPVNVVQAEPTALTSVHKKDFECAMKRGLPCDCLEKTGECHCGQMGEIFIKEQAPTHVATAAATASGMGLSYCDYFSILKK